MLTRKEPLVIEKAGVVDLTLPLNQTFRIAYGQHDCLHNVFLCLELSSGIKGYGEAAVATHVTGESVEETLKNLRDFSGELIGRDVAVYRKICLRAAEKFKDNRSSLAAVEMAVLDVFCRAEKIPLWNFFGPQSRPMVTDVTIVLGGLEETREKALQFSRQGFRALKIKVGKDHDLDIRRILLTRNIAPKAKILIDANQSFSASEALSFLRTLAHHKIHPILIEQPVPQNDWDGLKTVTRDSAVPVCADESISSLKDVKKIIHGQYADVINIKLMKFGFLEAQKMVLLAKKAGLKLMIGAMMESNLSSTAAAHFAAGLGGFDFIDLDTPFFVRGEAERNPHLDSRGTYNLKKVNAGIGIVPPLE